MGASQRAAHSAANWWGLVLRLPSSLAALPVIVLLLCSGRHTDGSAECPLITNGRLTECTANLSKTPVPTYTNDQLSESCKRSQLQDTPRCLKRIIDECQQVVDVDPAQIIELQNVTRSLQDRFDKICAEFLLHHSASSTSLPGGCSEVRETGLACIMVVTLFSLSDLVVPD